MVITPDTTDPSRGTDLPHACERPNLRIREEHWGSFLKLQPLKEPQKGLVDTVGEWQGAGGELRE